MVDKFLEQPVHCGSPDKEQALRTFLFEWMSDYWMDTFFPWLRQLQSEIPGVCHVGYKVLVLALCPAGWDGWWDAGGALVHSPVMKGVNQNLPMRCSHPSPLVKDPKSVTSYSPLGVQILR